LKAAEKRVLKRVALADPSLHYYSVLLSYKFGGEIRKKKDRIKKMRDLYPIRQ